MVTYFVLISLFSWLASVYYAAQGGTFQTPGVLIFSMLWSMFNLWLLLNFGFPAVI